MKLKRTIEPLLPHPDHPAFEAAVAQMIERRQGAYCVYGHSGRGTSEKWKCLIETKNRKEAEDFFWHRVGDKPKSGLDRKATRLECIGQGTIRTVGIGGETDGGYDSRSEVKASEARWEREHRQAVKQRARVVPMVRVAVAQPAVVDSFDEQAEHEAAEADGAAAIIKLRLRV